MHRKSEKEIRAVAQYLWEQAGKPVGQDDKNWLEAEKIHKAGGHMDQGKISYGLELGKNGHLHPVPVPARNKFQDWLKKFHFFMG